MRRHIAEIFLSVLVIRTTQTLESKVNMAPANAFTTTDLVVLGRPARETLIFLYPLLEFRDGEEIDGLLPMAYPDDGSNEFDKEIGELEKGRIEMIEKIDDESFDVRTIVVLN